MDPPKPATKTVVWERCFLLVGATAIAVLSARSAAGSWHDSSRLATIECLVDYHTFAIDQSIYVRVPKSTAPHPYAEDMPATATGTMDRVKIDGKFYSHQPPMPALLLALEYQIWRWLTGLSAQQRPDVFYFWLTLGSSGLAYVCAVLATHAMATRLSLTTLARLGLPISLAVSTVALAYTRNVNNHLMTLGVTAPLAFGLICLAVPNRIDSSKRTLLAALGCLSGLTYAFDSALGTPLLLCTSLLIVFRRREPRALAWFIIGALPWLVLHHAVNYSIGGTWRPYGAVPEYLAWEGSAFDSGTMTGVYNHASVWQAVSYAFGLLVGYRGFLIHNPPLLLAALAAPLLVRARVRELPEVVWAVTWSVATWVIYALFSNNYSGQCLSIRWFIPLLAPGFLVVAVYLKHFPRYFWAFAAISLWGAYFAVDSWTQGPWRGHP